MAKANLIAPFPADTDRDAFGHWLSGFVDGEGCFTLHLAEHKRPNRNYLVAQAAFTLSMRADESPALRLVQSYWGCGSLAEFRPTYAKHLDCKPQSVYRVTNAPDLHRILVPHFDRYQLRAKKRNDYAIWREAVAMLYAIASRPVERDDLGGYHPKWSPSDFDYYRQLRTSLMDGKKYTGAT